MAKGKKKDSKKSNKSDELLDSAAQSIKKFRKVTKGLASLTTSQKVLGGVALVAAGLTYLATRPATAGTSSTTPPDADTAENNLATPPAEDDAGATPLADLAAPDLVKPAPTPRKPRKTK